MENLTKEQEDHLLESYRDDLKDKMIENCAPDEKSNEIYIE